MHISRLFITTVATTVVAFSMSERLLEAMHLDGGISARKQRVEKGDFNAAAKLALTVDGRQREWQVGVSQRYPSQ